MLAAAILGFSFAAINAVASRVYSEAGEDARELLLTAPAFRRLTSVAITVASMGVLFQVNTVLGLPPSSWTIATILIALLTLLFLTAGMAREAWRLASPDALGELCIARLDTIFEAAARYAKVRADRSILEEMRSAAGKSLHCYRRLLTITPPNDALTNFFDRGIWCLVRYARVKSALCSESGWHTPAFRHENWFLANYSSIRTNRMAAPLLIPVVDVDHLSVEKEMIEILQPLFVERSSTSPNSTGIIIPLRLHLVAHRIQKSVRSLGETLALDEAILLLEAAAIPLFRTICNTAKSAEGRDRQYLADSIAAILSAPREALVGSAGSLERDAASRLLSRIGATSWAGHVITNFPAAPPHFASSLSKLERISRWEASVENRVVSPAWYLAQLVTADELRLLSASAQRACEIFETLCESVAERRADLGVDLLASFARQAIEESSQLSRVMGQLARATERFRPLWRWEDLTWPQIDVEAARAHLTSLRQKNVRQYADSLRSVAAQRLSEDWPDFVGHAQSLLGGEAHSAAVEGNLEYFDKVFPAFLEASCLAHDAVAAISTLTSRAKVDLPREPLVDVLELSGIVIVRSIVTHPGLAAIVVDSWSRYLKESGDAAGRLKYFAGALEQEISIASFAGNMSRFGWNRSLETFLSEHGSEILGAKKKSSVEQAVGAYLAESGPGGAEPRDLFLALLWLAHGLDLLADDCPRRLRRLFVAIEASQRGNGEVDGSVVEAEGEADD
jgi:hypothetical protein